MTASGSEQVRAQALEVAAGWAAPDAPPSWRLTAALFEVIAGHDAGHRDRRGPRAPVRTVD